MNLLERDDFQSFLTGCIRTERNGSGLSLYRHTAKQVATFGKNESWGIRSRCAAGIKLNLETDSRTLDLTGRIRAGARTYAGFDVEADDQVITALRVDTSEAAQTLRLAEFATQTNRRISLARHRRGSQSRGHVDRILSGNRRSSVGIRERYRRRRIHPCAPSPRDVR